MVLWRVIVLVALSAATAAAQTPFSSAITGKVRDATSAVLPDASVSITAPTLIGGQQTVSSDARGDYRFTLLPPGVYDVAVTAAGFRPTRHVAVHVASGATVTVDLSLEVAGPTDELVIFGESPVVDVTSAAVPVRLDESLLQNLPTERSIASMINLAPGVSADVAFGGSQEGNEILLDGVRMNEPALQEPALRANYNWVQEMNVVALGAPAEFGGFTGAAAYAALRSGANRFSGLGEFWTTRPNWLSNNTRELSQTLQRRFDSRRILDWYDSGAQLGGPLRRDRLFFFAGVQGYRYNDKPAGYDGPGSTDERDLQAIVRPTAAVTSSLRLDGFFEIGRHDTDAAYLGPEFPLESSSNLKNPQTVWNLHAIWTAGDATVVEARTGGFDKGYYEDTNPEGQLSGPAPRYDIGLGTWSQNANWVFRNDSDITTSSVTLSHTSGRGPGPRHVFKLGMEFEATQGFQETRYPGDRNYYDNFGAPFQLEIWGGSSGTATTRRWVLHAQDTWAVSDRITLSPGIRFEWNRGSVPEQKNVFRTGTIAPRIGLAWDLGTGHRTVARVHYGHYFDPIFSSRIMSEDHSDESESSYLEWSGTEWIELSRWVPPENFDIDPDLQHSHVKQLIAGVEHELFADVSLQAQYIRRRFDTYMGLIDTGSIYAPAQRPDPGPDGALGTTDDGGLLDVFALTNPGSAFNLYTNPPGAFNRFDAVQVVTRKRYSRGWQLQGSYTWSRNRGTVGNRWHVNAARFNLGRPGNFVNPNSFINAYGRASFDPTHEVKVLGSYRLPWWGGTMVSGVYRYTTGQAWGRTAFIAGLPQGGENVRIEPQGTRRLDAINRLDVRLEKTLPLPGPGGRLGLFFDVFNLTNQGVIDSDVTNPVAQNSSARFGEPNQWVDPRMLRVGLRLVF